jgi:uncharacterized membrane protein YdbT with pleckstrin-like domain
MTHPEQSHPLDEDVLFRSRPHWTIALPALFGFLFLIGFTVAVIANRRESGVPPLGLGAAFLLWLVVFGRSLGDWLCTSYIITPFRVSFRTGLIVRSGVDISVDCIRDARFGQSAFERLLGYGHVVVVSAGSLGRIGFRITDPEWFQAVIHAVRGSRSPEQVGAPSPMDHDIARLQSLAGLRERGLITEERFAAAKSALLR